MTNETPDTAPTPAATVEDAPPTSRTASDKKTGSETAEQAVKAAHDLLLVVLGGALSLFGGYFSHRLQSEQQERRDNMVRIAQQQADAVEALKEVGGRMDQVTVRALIAARAAKQGVAVDSLTKLVAEYRRAKLEWDMGLNRARILAGTFFGMEEEKQLMQFDKHVQALDPTVGYALQTARDLASYRRLPASSFRRRAEQSATNVLNSSASLVEAVSATAYGTERAWAAMIRARIIGSFDPHAELGERFPIRDPDSIRGAWARSDSIRQADSARHKDSVKQQDSTQALPP
jgi:hypothetical protein